jgi:D-sedoheptulose 7-phosphate isomerase
MPRLASDFARRYVETLQALLERLPLEALDRVVAAIEAARAEGRQIFLVGNGGSAATASHLMNDLCKGTLDGGVADAPERARRLRVVALTDNVSLLTAWANDAGFLHVFSEPLRSLAQTGDLLVAISVSGSSPNVLAAVDTAHELGLQVVGLTGGDGGELARRADVAFVVPSNDHGQVEDCHLVLDHILTRYLREALRSTPGEASRG